MSTSPTPAQAPEVLDEDEEHRLDQEAVAEAEVRGWISGEAVKRWLRSWGKPDELPPPQVGD